MRQDLDLQTLRFFCAAVEEGSLTRAAHRLNYAQSNLSTRIHALEEELGAVLFERSSEGVRLTARGEVLYAYAQRLLHLAGETASAVREEDVPAGTLQLGSMESAALSFLPALLMAYHRQYPNVRTILHTMPSQQAIEAVLDYRLDAAIVGGEVRHPQLETVPLTREQLVLIAPEDGPVDALLRMPLVAFPRSCAYRRRLEEIRARWGVVSDEVMEMESLGAIFASVSAGLGVSLFPRSTVEALGAGRQVAVAPLPFEQADIPVSMIHRREGSVRAAIRAMARCFQEASGDI